VGRFISVVLVVLAAAGAITSAVPALFDQVEPFLPLTPALEGFRAIASGGTGAGGAVGLLLAWLVVGLAASVLAVARQRMVPVAVVSPS
jgi:putative membrane protein